jgi:hypothetical protein
MNPLLADIQNQLEQHPGSYRFLYTKPESVNSPYIFVGLNPGGTETDPKDLFVKEGNAFINEKWSADGKKYNPLQQQVQALFQGIVQEQWQSTMSEKWLISNYVFYRSPRWATMQTEEKKPHIAASKMIWRQLFSQNKPRVVIANGFDTYTNMLALLKADGFHVTKEDKTTKAWLGPHTAIIQKDQHRCLLIGFGHLSTFKVINRPESKPQLDKVYALIKEYTTP